MAKTTNKSPGRGHRAELLLEVTNRVAAATTLNAQLEAVVDAATRALGAERGSLFLNDPATSELYARVALGAGHRDIRLPNTNGIAGHVFTTRQGLVINNPYQDPRFDKSIDEDTGFVTANLVCAPVRTVQGEVIGVTQVLNRPGGFTTASLDLLTAINQQGSVLLQGTLFRERVERSRERDAEFLDVVTEVSSEIQLGPLLRKIMETVTRMLDAERSTLFLHDAKTGELYTEIGQGLGSTKLRLPSTAGIAGAVFTSGKSINIPHAYADLRFNPSFDRKTGFFTRSILCVPVVNKNGRAIGVTQVLNKRGGPFTAEDEARLRAFTAQISIGLENAQLFDVVQSIKNYNESMLESMSSAVLTIAPDGVVVTANSAAQRMLRRGIEELVGVKAEVLFEASPWVAEKMALVARTRALEVTMDAALTVAEDHVSVNATVTPLVGGKGEALGQMLLFDDISNEKRLKATMSRYMDSMLADQIVSGGADILGGQSRLATILFSDIRGFTTMSEMLGPQETVAMLNEYFTAMVDCIQKLGGMLDKFIGDAIMAVFGTPFPHDDDEDRAVRAALAMLTELRHLNLGRMERGQPEIAIGVGINTGIVVSGNIGSPKRMDYTVVGDGVNLASRLEGACKEYGVPLLVASHTYDRLRGRYFAREIDQLVVKGKTEPVGVFEVLDHHTPDTFPNMADVLTLYQNGMRLMRARQFGQAAEAFTEALRLNPADAPSRIYVKRCRLLEESPPPADWNGVSVMTHK